ncbi:MAG: pilus assembly protein PilM [Patescibacteria group bacterium]
MKKSFSEFFPIPKFLEMRSVGLAISERSVHAIEFVKGPKGLRVGRFGLWKIPAGAIKGGYVNDKKVVTDVLRKLQKDLSIEFVSASLPEEKAYLFKTEFPKAGVTDLRETIEFRLEDNAPVSARDSLFDFAVIPGQPDSDHVDVSVSVLPTKVVEVYLEIIKDAGLKPVSLEVEATAISRAVVPAKNLGTFLIVNVGKVSTYLSIVSRGVVQFSITIPIGADSLTAGIAKHFAVDMPAAKKIKEERGFVKAKENTEVFLSLVDAVSGIRDEVNKLSVYWQTHRNSPGATGKKIEKIILCGRDTSLVGFSEYLSTSVKIPVELANVWQNAFSFDDFTPSISFRDSLNYASAIGLALPDEINMHV